MLASTDAAVQQHGSKPACRSSRPCPAQRPLRVRERQRGRGRRAGGRPGRNHPSGSRPGRGEHPAAPGHRQDLQRDHRSQPAGHLVKRRPRHRERFEHRNGDRDRERIHSYQCGRRRSAREGRGRDLAQAGRDGDRTAQPGAAPGRRIGGPHRDAAGRGWRAAHRTSRFLRERQPAHRHGVGRRSRRRGGARPHRGSRHRGRKDRYREHRGQCASRGTARFPERALHRVGRNSARRDPDRGAERPGRHLHHRPGAGDDRAGRQSHRRRPRRHPDRECAQRRRDLQRPDGKPGGRRATPWSPPRARSRPRKALRSRSSRDRPQHSASRRNRRPPDRAERFSPGNR